MLRTKLIVAFVGLLSPAILIGLLLYWGPRQMEQRLERTLLAHNEVQAYLALALETYRHLQQLEYEVTLAGGPRIRRTCPQAASALTRCCGSCVA
jgi:hypothetical protein